TCEKLFELAVTRWTTAGEEDKGPSAEQTTRGAAAWALEQLVTLAQHAGDHRSAVDLLVRGAALPFQTAEVRRMKRAAAVLSAARLKDSDAALALYRDLLRDDPTDEAALASIDAFAELLGANHLDDELVALWEQQATRVAKAGDGAKAAE